MSVLRVHDNKETAELAAQFNEFYLKITLSNVSQIGNYRIIEEIGEGAFGKVYLAQHLILRMQVVLKCGLLDDPNIVREIYYHRQLRHKNIVKLYEVIRTESHLWMALEYCEGLELFYYIYEKRRLNIDVCRHLFYQIVDGIKYVHSLNLCHRDLKLENILLADKRKSVVKLTDFGFVREFKPNKRQFLSTVCGTTAYMAPEVLKNEKYSGFAVDIWSLGVILYAMLYGELPFDEDDELKTKYRIIHEEPVFREFVSPETNNLLKRMLCKDPWARPSLTEIFNLPFLIDITNQKLERNSLCNDAESILSISQHYKLNAIPFQSKTERLLLKKLEKLNVDIEALQAAVFSGETNSLTAFYELALTQEFRNKKDRYLRKKRYYEAKMLLKKLRKRMRSALSLDQAPTQPLERIISSLSILSRADNASKSNLSRKSLEGKRPPSNPRRSLDVHREDNAHTEKHTDIGISTDADNHTDTDKRTDTDADTHMVDENSHIHHDHHHTEVAVPFKRTVSFHPDDRSTASISGSTHLKKNKFLDKIQFWRKAKNREILHNVSFDLTEPIRKCLKPETVLLMDSELDVAASLDQHQRDVSENTIPLAISVDARQMQISSSHDSYSRRTRPESVVSQVSQLSQLSQFPMSESELDMLDGTDMDDYYYEDGVYELSINTSQHDLPHKPTPLARSLSQSSYKKKRSLALYSLLDGLLVGKKKYPLSQVSSNSSDESSVRSKLVDRFLDDSALPTRPISPRMKISKKVHPKLRNQKSASPQPGTSHMHTPQPIAYPTVNGIARSHSPPIRMRKTDLNGLMDISNLHNGATNGSPNGMSNGGITNGSGGGVNGNGALGNSLGNGLFDTIQVNDRMWKRDMNGSNTPRRFEFINEEGEEEDDEK